MLLRLLARRPHRTRSRTRRLLAILPVGVAASLAVMAPDAAAGLITPESGGSPNADTISLLYKLTLAIGAVIFLLVEGILVYSLVRFRARRGAAEPAQIRGNTRLEIGWTAAAAMVLVVLAVVTFVFLGAIQTPPPSGPGGLSASAGGAIAQAGEPPARASERPLEIVVNGQQYLWRYDYPSSVGGISSYYEMVVPVNTTVKLSITSQDVAHSWWIPKLGGKKDAIPGYVNDTWFKISEPGIYEGQCAELCGENHAAMRATVRALPVAQFEAWSRRQAAAIKASQLALERQRARRSEAQ